MRVRRPGLAPALFWLAVASALAMALLPAPPIPQDIEVSDKAWHVLAFAVITFLAAAGYPSRRFAELFLAIALLGGLIEVLQMIPQLGRDPELGDWIADCGASFVALIAWFIIRGVLALARPGQLLGK